MTVKNDLHALVDELDEQGAQELLAYAHALRGLPARPSPAFISETQAALDESADPMAIRLPHAAVRDWLLAWGTPAEDAATQRLQALEEELRQAGGSPR
jgi:hypothetical protein